jgi:hypothetical protein
MVQKLLRTRNISNILSTVLRQLYIVKYTNDILCIIQFNIRHSHSGPDATQNFVDVSGETVASIMSW